MIITAAQLRAARGLLDWTRSELAKASGLSPETIKNIEHGIYTPQEATIKAILDTFSQNDVEFTESEGVRIRKNEVRVFSGKNSHINFLDHVYSVLKDGGGRICQFNLSDTATVPYLGDSIMHDHMERMSRIPDLDARVLTPDEDIKSLASYCEYRRLDKTAQKIIPYYVYNDYVCMPIVKNGISLETVSIHSKLLSDAYAEQFELFWQSAANIQHKKTISSDTHK